MPSAHLRPTLNDASHSSPEQLICRTATSRARAKPFVMVVGCRLRSSRGSATCSSSPAAQSKSHTKPQVVKREFVHTRPKHWPVAKVREKAWLHKANCLVIGVLHQTMLNQRSHITKAPWFQTNSRSPCMTVIAVSNALVWQKKKQHNKGQQGRHGPCHSMKEMINHNNCSIRDLTTLPIDIQASVYLCQCA
jgi:hypothetical protein